MVAPRLLLTSGQRLHLSLARRVYWKDSRRTGTLVIPRAYLCAAGLVRSHSSAPGVLNCDDPGRKVGQQSTSKSFDQNRGPDGEPIEPIEAVRNAGEFPTLTDQGEGRYPLSGTRWRDI